MKERPIIMTAESVRAILEGRKTQTRRIVRELARDPDCARLLSVKNGVATFGHSIPDDPVPIDIRCPYGVPGDRLWVRETWCAIDRMVDGFEREDPMCVGYKADHTARKCYGGDGSYDFEIESAHQFNWQHESIRWRPSIYMPRWASRLFLEVTAVRVEMLQDISEEDARAEGCDGAGLEHLEESHGMAAPLIHFASLWEDINGRRSPWERNDWVWVIEFRRVEAARDVQP